MPYIGHLLYSIRDLPVGLQFFKFKGDGLSFRFAICGVIWLVFTACVVLLTFDRNGCLIFRAIFKALSAISLHKNPLFSSLFTTVINEEMNGDTSFYFSEDN